MKYLFLFSCLVFAVIALPLALGKVPPNGLYGYRTARTLADPAVWYAVNRASGWALFVGALIAAAAVSWVFSLEIGDTAKTIAGTCAIVAPVVCMIVAGALS